MTSSTHATGSSRDPQAVRAQILATIVRYEGAASISEIAEASGLSTAPVRTQVEAMVTDGTLVEIGDASDRGRRYGPRP